ncbi:MAG: hypothetical protein GC159_07965 [Phycisphaera sp.]|nr:hypothetical protein [Phycisphaera sp.]
MNKRSLRALIVLNVVLLVMLGIFSFAPQPAEAQLGGASNYMMIAGQSQGTTVGTVYIIDAARGGMIAVQYNIGKKRLESVGWRVMTQDFAAQQGIGR